MLCLDFHDDPSLVPGASDTLTRAELDRMPSNRFALVVDDGTSRHKKFLCDDGAHTRLSVAAFDKTAALLPEPMRIAAASNLRAAALLYGVPVPQLEVEEVRGNVVYGRLPEQEKVAEDSLGSCMSWLRWYEDHGASVLPAERRPLALALQARLAEHHLPLPPKLAKYAGEGFSGNYEGACLIRRTLVAGNEEALDCLEKIAAHGRAAGPEWAAEALAAFDGLYDLDHLWGGHLPDPYESVYGGGPMHEKAAAESTDYSLFEWKLRRTFGDKFYEDLLRNPAVRDALPTPERELLAEILGE